MNFRWVVLGHLRSLRTRWTRTALLVIAVGAGVSLVMGVFIAKTSLDASLDHFRGAIVGDAALRVEAQGDHGALDQSMLVAVAATPGVKVAVPLVLSIVEAADSNGHTLLVPALGIDCSISAVIEAFGCTPETLAALGDNPALGQALQERLGPTGELRTNLAEIPTAPALALEPLNAFNKGMVAVFELGASQRHLTRPNGLDQILVVPTPGADLSELRVALTRVVGPANRVVAADAPVLGSVVVTILLPFLFLISLIGLVIGGQLVRNTLELSLEERRREFATAGALGAVPRQLFIGLLCEAALVGVFGALVALVGGNLVARAFIGALSNELSKATGLRMTTSSPSWIVLVALAGGVGVSVLSALRPARRATRLDLVAELTDRARFETPNKNPRLGLIVTATVAVLCLALGAAAHSAGGTEAWQPIASIAALAGTFVVLYVGCAQLTPLLLAHLQRAPGFTTGPMRVALGNILSARRRTIAVVIAITAPVAVTTVFGGIVPGMQEGAARFAREIGQGHVWVSTLPTNNSAGIDSKVTPDIEAKLRAFPGVAAIEHSYFMSYDAEQFAAVGYEGRVPDFSVYQGRHGPDALARGEVMLGPAMARQRNVAPGDTVTIPTRIGGTATFTVGGIWASAESVGNSIAMTSAQLLAFAGERPSGSLSLVPAPGVSPVQLAASLRAAHLSPRLRIHDPDQLAGALADDFTSITAPISSLQYALVLVSLVATSSTLVLAAAQRRRQNAVLAALGMSPRDLALATVLETLAIALATAFVATMLAQLMLLSFSWASATVTGLEIPYRVSFGPALAAAGITTVIALIGSTVPAWRTARTNVMTALRTA